jgi:hypothetical protein
MQQYFKPFFKEHQFLMNEDNTSQELDDLVARNPSGSTIQRKPSSTPNNPTSSPNNRNPTPSNSVPNPSNRNPTPRNPIPNRRIPSRGNSRLEIIVEILRILDAGGTAPPWQDELNPITKKPYISEAEYNLWRSLNPEQARAIRNTYTPDQLRNVTNPERNSRGCFLLNAPRYNTTSAQQVAIEAISGKSVSQLVVHPDGRIAIFDARVSKRVVGEVDTSLPESQYSDLSVPETLRTRQRVANDCGLTMKVYSTNQSEVDKATRRGFAAQILKMGGAYGAVRGNVVKGQVHHMPAKSVSPISRNYTFENRFDDPGPGIWMRVEDHKLTGSFGSRNLAVEYRARQAALINQGRFREAFQMDIDNIRSLFPDGRYEPGIRQAMEQVNVLERSGRLSKHNSRLSIKVVADASLETNSSLQENNLEMVRSYQTSATSNESQSLEVGNNSEIPTVNPPSNEDWARFNAAARALTSQLNTYDLTNISVSLLEKPLTTPQDYAQMLSLSTSVNLDKGKYTDPTSPFSAQKVGSNINIFSNSSKIATIDLTSNKVTLERPMTEAEKQSLEEHRANILSSIETQAQAASQKPPSAINQAQR